MMHLRSAERRGMATMLVLCAVAFASILGLAILSNSSLQSMVTQNQVYGYQSDCLAESGINLAEYYLLNPSKAPVLTNGYYPGETGISFGTLMAGTVDVTVTQQTPPDHYLITTKSHAAGVGLSRSLTKQIQTCNAAQKYALESAASINIPANVSITGNVGVMQTLSTSKYATITGNTYAVVNGTNSGTISGSSSLVTIAYFSIPSTATDYRTYYYYNGTSWQSCTANNLYSYTVLGYLGLTPVTLGATTSNPAGIYYTTQAITILNNVTINGTVETFGQDLTFDGSGNSITAATGFPALIINGNLVNAGYNGALTVNGVTWLSGVMKSSGSVSGWNLKFNGAAIFGGTSASIASGMGNVTMTYNAGSSSVTHLGPDDSITDLYWQQ